MALGIGLIAVLVVLLVATLASGLEAGPIGPGPSSTFLGLYLMAWGAMFLASYYFSHKTFFLRGLIWVCEHWSSPKGRGMAFFYAALAMLLGGLAVLSGLGLIDVAA
ncbi:hypothetical protein GCM10011521_28210 [Arenimonas soli]|uniref:Uncharacterized protein n=1 Tax=Arenimonas soli TaxID=2269504 RepID=A0ABQ1HI23_9GAMM|nr:hypothetical protein GCM10011521_16250 [Arenimonas soli]GGA88200.1 hypothetical protein GCM10011521_28210 [Arenimonas soli]